MAKDSGKIHYLRNVTGVGRPEGTPPQAPSPHEDLIRRLESRMERIEKSLDETIRKLERTEGIKEGVARSELSSLVRGLEQKVQRVSEEIRSGRAFGGRRDLTVLREVVRRMRTSLSPEGFKNILRSFWFGQPEDSYEVDEFGLDPAFVKRAKPLFDFLYYNYWRVRVLGLQHIPSEGRGLIVANHSGTLPYDGSMIALSIQNDHPSRRDVRFLVEDFVYHFPFLGTCMYRIGGVRACPENAERLLTRNHLVAVFPEGVKGVGKLYKHRYSLQRFGRGGFIKLALRTNSPILPTAVIGAEEIHPLIYKSTILARPLGIPYIPVTPTLPLLGPLGLIPLPSKWTIVFGEPILFSPKYGPKDAEDQLLINRLSEMVRGKIQDMVVEALKNRRSIWFG